MSLLLFLLRAVWYVFLYHVSASEWLSVEANALPLLRRTGRPPWRPIAGAFLFGLAAGLVSAALFSSLGVTESDAVKQMRALLPGVEELSPIIIASAGLFMLTAIAVSEELLFRGVLLGFRVRLSKDNRLVLAASMTIFSLLWALLHLQNTNVPLLKFAQIFALGIVFCIFARRGLLEAAI
ncbi:MAG: CPBP family intramembrane metalloprotease, partial [Candidatus Brocadiia bacterium]|nr:CPBP family intramembrane metalloprotease [Candidatus Brocadiia bacterium]